jgi:hypothetical protein
MKTNITNLLVAFLLLALTNVLNAQCTKEDIKVPSDLAFDTEIKDGPKTLILETIGVKELRLSLYNSRGAKIFESTSSILGASKEVEKMVDTGWDGTKLGEKLKVGFYVYTIEAECTDRSTIYKTGQIVLSAGSGN